MTYCLKKNDSLSATRGYMIFDQRIHDFRTRDTCIFVKQTIHSIIHFFFNQGIHDFQPEDVGILNIIREGSPWHNKIPIILSEKVCFEHTTIPTFIFVSIQ